MIKNIIFMTFLFETFFFYASFLRSNWKLKESLKFAVLQQLCANSFHEFWKFFLINYFSVCSSAFCIKVQIFCLVILVSKIYTNVTVFNVIRTCFGLSYSFNSLFQQRGFFNQKTYIMLGRNKRWGQIGNGEKR